MSRRGDDTRMKLLTAAEQAWAERGVDAVSLNEINREAGLRNASGLQYHFGGRDGLLRAVLERHQREIDRRRQAALDALEPLEEATLRELVGALVQPLAEHVLEAEGGADYIKLATQLLSSPEGPRALDPGERAGRERLMAATRDACDPLPESLFGPRAVLVMELLFHGLRIFVNQPNATPGVFVENLVDCLTALLAAPVSDATRSKL